MAASTHSPKIFLTGATGYLGGQLLLALLSLSPTPQITALVRTSAQSAKLTSAYPSLHTVTGDLDSHSTLVSEASKADIVIQCADCDHEAGILSIVEGVARGTKEATASNASRPKPVLIQVSGSGNLVDPAYLDGDADPKVYSDRDSVAELAALPADRPHVAVERAMVAAAEKEGVDALILAPGMIFGRSESLFHPETFNHVVYVAWVEYGCVAMIGKGENMWGWVSVRDCAGAIVFFVEKALVAQASGGKGGLEFGSKGYYFIGTGEVAFRERAEVAAKRLLELGKVQREGVESVSIREVERLSKHPHFPMLVRSNSRFRADRLSDLGWKAKEEDWRPLMAAEGGERV